ncbi:hypothetical protein SpCBS45565_g07838 [Spizellomyces sp. 'palustris']|nr:hypothetical protein SpCBS45565_g07838 [Spizellomyces sp. 'palustris']
MTRIDLIIKIGGSVLTDKPSYETLSPRSLLDPLFDSISNLHGTTGFLLIHGAGSFGHPHAHAAGLSIGFTPPSPKHVLGAAKTRHAVATLNRMVVGELIGRGIPAVSVNPGSWLDGDWSRGETRKPDPPTQTAYTALLRHVTALINGGYVPVLHGDVVSSPSFGSMILSGDDLVVAFAYALKPRRGCVFLTDVDGIFDRDPKVAATAELLRTIHVNRKTESSDCTCVTSESITVGSAMDVTGGMSKKLASAIAVVRGPLEDMEWNCRVVLVKAGSDDASKAMAGDLFNIGTTMIGDNQA